MKGYWVVFEDIDKAPADVQSIILPLLEGASSFLTGHGEVIYYLLLALSFLIISCPHNWSEPFHKNVYAKWVCHMCLDHVC